MTGEISLVLAEAGPAFCLVSKWTLDIGSLFTDVHWRGTEIDTVGHNEIVKQMPKRMRDQIRVISTAVFGGRPRGSNVRSQPAPSASYIPMHCHADDWVGCCWTVLRSHSSSDAAGCFPVSLYLVCGRCNVALATITCDEDPDNFAQSQHCSDTCPAEPEATAYKNYFEDYYCVEAGGISIKFHSHFFAQPLYPQSLEQFTSTWR